MQVGVEDTEWEIKGQYSSLRATDFHTNAGCERFIVAIPPARREKPSATQQFVSELEMPALSALVNTHAFQSGTTRRSRLLAGLIEGQSDPGIN